MSTVFQVIIQGHFPVSKLLLFVFYSMRKGLILHGGFYFFLIALQAFVVNGGNKPQLFVLRKMAERIFFHAGFDKSAGVQTLALHLF